ncbi:MAG: TetR/AcrR family transcriptional regulator [Lachnospiraceae bacterium]|nr:TetR/AcrR family transcriptional regulator [Lachnospiraceae bacterium]
MAKKAILEGGKRDEIIYVAMQLFFEKGYEATSVRMILDKVNGEVGMFYHYFKSKDELFQKVVERFFADYRQQFSSIIEEAVTKEEFFERLLEHYEEGMRKFHGISGNMHWTIQYAMSARTIEEMKPSIIKLVDKWRKRCTEPVDIVAGQVLYGISATLHSESFQVMSKDEKKQVLIDLANRLL